MFKLLNFTSWSICRCLSKVSSFVACIRAHVCSNTLRWRNSQITKADNVSRAKAVKFLAASSFAR